MRSSWTLLIGRALFGSLFVLAGLSRLSVEAIASASLGGVPAALLLVPAGGLLSVFGGLSAALGWRTRAGATALAAVLLASALASRESATLVLDFALLGGALILRELGPGPMSVDSFRRRRAF